MVYSGSKTVAAAGARERLASSRTPACWVNVQALQDNSGDVYIGGNNVAPTVGNYILTGDSQFFPPVGDVMIYDLHEMWIDVETNGEGVQFDYGVR